MIGWLLSRLIARKNRRADAELARLGPEAQARARREDRAVSTLGLMILALVVVVVLLALVRAIFGG